MLIRKEHRQRTAREEAQLHFQAQFFQRPFCGTVVTHGESMETSVPDFGVEELWLTVLSMVPIPCHIIFLTELLSAGPGVTDEKFSRRLAKILWYGSCWRSCGPL